MIPKIVREATLSIGDCVLVRQVVFKGRPKKSNKWENYPYIVIGIPNEHVPVFQVQKQSGGKAVKILHRNMFLPFSAFPGINEAKRHFPKWNKPVVRTRNAEKNWHSEIRK